MNKKTKKQMQVLRQRIQKLELQLAGARQSGDRGEVEQMETELATTRTKLEKLKESG